MVRDKEELGLMPIALNGFQVSRIKNSFAISGVRVKLFVAIRRSQRRFTGVLHRKARWGCWRLYSCSHFMMRASVLVMSRLKLSYKLRCAIVRFWAIFKMLPYQQYIFS